MSRKQKSHIYYITFLLAWLPTWSLAFAESLSLKKAEYIAIERSTEIQSFRAKNESLFQAAIAAGQYPDPHLFGGTLNVPVDTFNFSQTPMTQIQVGLGQYLPRGKSLHYNMQEKNCLAQAEIFKLQSMRLDILQKVRLSWLHLYYWQQARKIVLKEKKVFIDLLEVAKSMLANNKAQQKDVIRAQLELTELENKLIQIDEQIQTARFQLGRWIGESQARRAQTANKLHLTSLPSKNNLLTVVKQHPELKTDSATISAFQAKVRQTLEQYKPGFNVNVGYGFRQGRELDGRKRSDFLSATINMDLPVFPKNRQDRSLKASEDNLLASEKERMSHFRNLREYLNIQYSIWQQQQKSTQLYTTTLIPQANQYATATMTAYQNFQTDFPTLARAYVRQLNTELEGLKAKVDRDAARINLLYLQGQ
ncbi:TPA: TolC family protein [Legionella pneumophila]|nr:TolC family protein [Legionella pneumophila]HAT7919989.1 TolC family protein [Legionella pneumophila]HAT7924342.1 TolC family protein [Legionella pneumophila]HAT7934203.1 TolC family protein [Legionella pneumophila]HAT8327855.1 TolC family protein [Legionella pneumophila]